MQRPQKTAKVGYPCEGMLETDSNKGACSVAQLETERQVLLAIYNVLVFSNM